MAGTAHGGAELFYERLTIALHQAGETVLPVIRRDPHRADRLAMAGTAARQLGFSGSLDFLTRPRLRRILRRFHPTVVVAWMSRAAATIPSGDWTLVGRLGGYYNLSYYRRCDHLIGNTRAIVDWIVEQGCPATQVHYLPNFVPDMAGADPISQQTLGVPAGKRIVLGLGRLHPNKGFDILIRALPRLPDVHAVIAGEGPERSNLIDVARREKVSDRVHLLGWQRDTAALLAAASLLVCPSRHEPLGNVLIEAWSSCCPVVACAADGPRELIGSDDGILVPLNDPAALAEGIAAVLDDGARAATLSRAGRKRFEQEFAQGPVVELWRCFFRQVGAV